jgi:signal transduction histidine kinase
MKRRLVLAIAAVALGSVVLFAIPLALVLQRSYRDEELLRLQRDTVAATRGIDLSRGVPDQIELPRFSGGLAIYSTAGVLVAGAGPPRADQATRRALSARAPVGTTPGGRLVVAVPLLSGEQITGAVRSQRSQAVVAARTRGAWWKLTGLGAAVIAIAAFAALALGRRIARPLETLAVAARRVGEGDFTVRAPATAIREIDDLATALNLSSRRISELIGRERNFSADASHQLRTPLAALRLELETASLESPELQPALSPALAQVDRLEGTISTLLAVARGTHTDEPTVELVAAIRDFEARWHGRLAAIGRPLRTAVDPEVAAARISPAVLAEIVDVLLDNACAHGAGTVTVILRQAAGSYVLEVADQGPGFGSDPEAPFQATASGSPSLARWPTPRGRGCRSPTWGPPPPCR